MEDDLKSCQRRFTVRRAVLSRSGTGWESYPAPTAESWDTTLA